MLLEQKLKAITLKITLRHVLRNTHASSPRTCRHIIALGKDLSNETLSTDTLIFLQEELKEQLPHMSEEQVKSWLIKHFHLY